MMKVQNKGGSIVKINKQTPSLHKNSMKEREEKIGHGSKGAETFTKKGKNKNYRRTRDRKKRWVVILKVILGVLKGG